MDLGWSYQFYLYTNIRLQSWFFRQSAMEENYQFLRSHKYYPYQRRRIWNIGTLVCIWHPLRKNPYSLKRILKEKSNGLKIIQVFPYLGIVSKTIQTSDGGFAYEDSGSIIETDANKNTMGKNISIL